MKRKYFFLTIIVLLVTVLTGCGAQPSDTSSIQVRASDPNNLEETLSHLAVGIEQETLEKLAEDPQNYRIYYFDRRGTRRDFYRGLILLPNPSESGDLIELADMRVNFGNGDLEPIIASDESSEPSDLVYRRSDNTTYSKYLVNSLGRTVGLYSVAEGLRLYISIDLDGNEVADYVEIHDGLAHRVTVIVNETVEALRFYDDLIQGKNALCLMPEVSTTSSDSDGFAVDVPDRAKIFGCDNSLADSPSGVTPNRIRGTGNESVVDRFCNQVLAMSGRPFSFDSRFAEGDISQLGVGIVAVGSAIAIGTGPVTGGVGAGVGATIIAFGAGIIIGDYIADELSSDTGGGADANRGEDSPGFDVSGLVPFDWQGFCQHRAQHAGSWSRETLDEMLENQDCAAPNEGENPAEKTSTLPGGSSGSGPVGPWVPFSPDDGVSDRTCVQPESFTDLEKVFRKAGDRSQNCRPSENPDMAGPCGDDTPTGGIGQKANISYGEIYIGYADLIGLKIFEGGDPAPIELPEPVQR